MATLHLFTRDLRLEDHPALLAGDGDRIGLFVFTAVTSDLVVLDNCLSAELRCPKDTVTRPEPAYWRLFR